MRMERRTCGIGSTLHKRDHLQNVLSRYKEYEEGCMWYDFFIFITDDTRALQRFLMDDGGRVAGRRHKRHEGIVSLLLPPTTV